VSDGAAVDERLATLLHLWDSLDEDRGQPNTLGMTVVVDGTTYSGVLVAGRVWSSLMAQLLRTAPGDRQLGALAVFYDQISESYEDAENAEEVRVYLHMANVCIGLPKSGEQTGLMMRVKASDVSAWAVGTVGDLPPLMRPPAVAGEG
jgi:hypothetical protein